MTPGYYTESTYKKLDSEKKRYLEIKGSPYFPIDKKYYDQWAVEVYDFLKSISL